jgi:predicted small integral membrane protein
MKSFLKKALFWTLFIPVGILIIFFAIMTGLAEWFNEMTDRYEHWSFPEYWKDS